LGKPINTLRKNFAAALDLAIDLDLLVKNGGIRF